MEKKEIRAVEQFVFGKAVHVPMFKSERTKVVLLCLSPGVSVPPHSHEGFELTLHPLKGSALLPAGDGTDITLHAGEVYFMDGSFSFNPKNPFTEDFQMLVHLVKK